MSTSRGLITIERRCNYGHVVVLIFEEETSIGMRISKISSQVPTNVEILKGMTSFKGWTIQKDTCLVTALRNLKQDGNNVNDSFISTAWHILRDHIEYHFNEDIPLIKFMNRWRFLKNTYKLVMKLLVDGTWTWDIRRNVTVPDDPTQWQNVNPKYRKVTRSSISRKEDELVD